MSEPHAPAIPDLAIAQKVFLLNSRNKPEDLLCHIREKNAAPLQKYIHSKVQQFPFHEEEFQTLIDKNKIAVEKLKGDISDAEEREGDIEVGAKYRLYYLQNLKPRGYAIEVFSCSIKAKANLLYFPAV